MKIKLFTCFLVLATCVETLFAESGTCGENLKWDLTDGVLTISGSGAMTDWSYDSPAPWYSHRENITSVSIDKRVTSIGEYAFYNCRGLTSIEIPNSVTSIGIMAFGSCSGLTNVTIPNSVTSIRKSAFNNCGGLTSIEIPNSVTSIGDGAFSFCSSLTSVTIGNNVTSLGEKAFHGCYRLTAINVATDNPYYSSVDGVVFNKAKTTLILYPGGKHGSYTIPNSVTNIGKYVFNSYKGLTSVTIPNSVKSIEEEAFNVCYYLTEINVATDNPHYCSVDGVLFNKTKTTLVQYPYGKQGTFYAIPNSVTSIGGYAFYSSHLTGIGIPNSVTSIGRGAFYGCFGLTSIEIPNSVKSIGSWAFCDCYHLTSVTIGNSVTSIGGRAFLRCSDLKEMIYPKGLDLSFADIPSSAALIAYDRNNPPQQQSNPSQPPLLAMQEGSLVFSDATHNNAINATEQCTIRFKIQNSGKGSANNCEARVKLSGSTSGIKVQTVKLPAIAVGQTYEVSIPITADISTQDGKVTFSIEVYEPNGWGIAPFDLTVATKAYEAPFLQVVDYQTASNSGKIKKMEPFTLTFNLQNTKYGDAEQVKVKVNLPTNIFVMDGSAEQSFAQIKSGETKTITLTLAANNNYPSTDIPVTIDVKERYGKFAENKQLNIALNQTTSSSINIAAKDEPQQERKEIQLAMMSSDVDRDIPQTDAQNNNTFVVIIANELYDKVAKVPFALNDGNAFHQYCEKTLGIPARNIHHQENATGGQLQDEVDWLEKVCKAFNKPNIIFYYAGHGVPNKETSESYLLPKDGNAGNMNTCYKLNTLYASLGEMKAERIVVFLDACFSGASLHDETKQAKERSVAFKAKPGTPMGNMVVFSSTQNQEIAYPYLQKQHGMFTYYLLKKLQESKGEATLQELEDYVKTNVMQQSVVENKEIQTPQMTPATTLPDDWSKWKLK